MIKDVEIVKATAENIRYFYPDGCPRTCYGWIAYYKGQPACFAGVTVERGGYVAFCDLKPDINAPKQTIWRAAKIMFENMRSLNLPMMAIYCEPHKQRQGQKFVERLGFRYSHTYDGMEIYKCLWQ